MCIWFSLTEQYLFSRKDFASILDRHLSLAATENGGMFTSSADILGKDEDAQCLECLINYGCFCVIYSGRIEKLIGWCQRRGVILKENKCAHCHNWCRVDFAKKAWRCDKKSPKYGRRKTNFVGYLAVSYFKLYVKDTTKHLHIFAKAAAHLYPPTQ